MKVERILITGASRGIGQATAVRLARSGRELLLHGRDVDALREVEALVIQRGGSARIVTGDLSRSEGVESLVEAVASPLTSLVNNAGVAIVKPLMEITLREWEESLALNLTAPFLLCQALAPRMAAGGTIVNVLSVAARQGFPGWGAYCAAKFGLEGLSQCLRQELRSAGVRVVNVYPAATATGLWNGVAGSWPRERMLSPEEVAEAVAFALERPDQVLLSELVVGHLTGTL